MANKPVSMSQVRSILKLFKENRSSRAISRQLHIHRNTVEGYRERVIQSGLPVSKLLQMSDADLAQIIYPKVVEPPPDTRKADLQARIPYLQTELHKRGVTRQLLWIEYRREVDKGYAYSQFCELLNRFLRPLDAVMHLTHRPGELLQVDFAGDTMSYVDLKTGEIIQCPVLVCTMPYSHFIYVEVLQHAKQEHLFNAMNHCLEYLQGAPPAIKFDNLKQVVVKASRYEPSITEISEIWSNYYDTTIMATRVRKPRDKASVEKGVDLAVKWIKAPLRNTVFHDVRQINKAILPLLDDFNRKGMSKGAPSRLDRFASDEKPLLKPLPAEPFLYKHISWGKVQKNYHVILGENWHQYSVPFQYIGERVKVVYDLDHVEIYLGFKRIAIHRRSFVHRGYTTLPEHMPVHHRKYHEMKGWDGDYFLQKAEKIGPNTTEIIKRILDSRTFIEQSYHSCIGIFRLADQVGNLRMEAACSRAVFLHKVGYGVINNILSKNLDGQPLPVQTQFTLPFHDNLRGTGSYN